MTCREFADFIAGYDSGDLSADVRASFDRHLGLCANCQRYLSQYRASVDLGRTAFDDLDAVVPETVPEDLINAILAARRR